MNRIQDFGKEKGIPSANKFWQKTGLPRATAFRLWRDRTIYPDRATVEVICKTLNAQPGDFLTYMEALDVSSVSGIPDGEDANSSDTVGNDV